MEQNKTREYTLKQRILTLFAIAIGIAFAWGVCGEYMWSGEPDMSSAMLIYGGFWLVYMAGFYFAAWDRAKRSVWGYVLLAVAAVHRHSATIVFMLNAIWLFIATAFVIRMAIAGF